MGRGRKPGRNPECWTTVNCSFCGKEKPIRWSDMYKAVNKFCNKECRWNWEFVKPKPVVNPPLVKNLMRYNNFYKIRFYHQGIQVCGVFVFISQTDTHVNLCSGVTESNRDFQPLKIPLNDLVEITRLFIAPEVVLSHEKNLLN